jgi:hypothetical protein
MYALGTYWTGVAFLFFMLGPSLPNSILKFLSGTILGNFVLVSLILGASKLSIGATLATFMAVAVIYVEYRQRVIAKIIWDLLSLTR